MLIGFEVDGEVVAGVSNLAPRKEMYSAVRGGGAWRNDSRISISSIDRPQNALICVNGMTRLYEFPFAASIIDWMSQFWAVRSLGGCLDAMLVASGHAELWIEMHAKEWDLAPLKIIAEESGARFMNFDGGSSIYGGNGVIFVPRSSLPSASCWARIVREPRALAAEANESAEFANIARSEQRFWWYRGMNRSSSGLLDPIARVRTILACSRSRLRHGLSRDVCSSSDISGQCFLSISAGKDCSLPGRSASAASLKRTSRNSIRADCFDAVLSMDVIVHFPRGEEDRAMSELVRVLSPGGLLAVRVSALDILRSRHSEFAHERQRFTRSRLVHLAGSCGVEVKRCTYANSLLMPVALAKFRVWEPLTRQAPASGVEPVHRRWIVCFTCLWRPKPLASLRD